MPGRRRVAPRRRDRRGGNPVYVGAVVLVLIAIGTYLGFAKHVPLTHGYRIRAVFSSPTLIRLKAPVRIAGVNVGKVTAVQRYRHSDMGMVTMEIEARGLPIHTDATAKIRPRLFLEGNFFVDVQPGSPSAPELRAGGLIPVSQTSTPVQLDQLLTALQSSARSGLQRALAGYGSALSLAPTPGQVRRADPEVKGMTGAQALNRSFLYTPGAFRAASEVNQALLGVNPHDLSRLLANIAAISRGLDADPARLQNLIADFNTTMAATAGQATNLSRAIRLLAPTLADARRAFADLDAALPATRAFAAELTPGVRELPATIAAANPWLAQAKPLLGPSELGGLTRQLQPAISDLARLTDGTLGLLPQLDLFDRCITGVILPTGDIKVDDGPLSAGTENYKEFWYAAVGEAGESQNFDGNGAHLRLATGGGGNVIKTGASNPSGRVLFGNAIAAPLGARPSYGGADALPPLRPGFPCYRNPIPEVNGPAASGTGDATVGKAVAPATLATRSAER